MGGFKLKIGNNNTPSDAQSINKTIDILKDNGCTGVGDLNTIDIYSTWDISGFTPTNIPFVAEVKDKTVTHDKYGDVLCDKAKLDEYYKQPFYESLLVFNYYSDGYVGVANPKDGYKVIERITPVTTEFGDKGMEKQTLISMPQQRLIKI